MSSTPRNVILGSVLGVTSSAVFFGANLGISFIAVPTLLLSSPSSGLPVPANAENRASPTSTSSEKPWTRPSHLARQWHSIYDIGKKAGPFFALLASGCWLHAARRLSAESRSQQRLLVAAAGLSVAVVPFTFVVMKRTNDELTRRATAAAKGEEEDAKADARTGTVEASQTHDLIRWWAQLNLL
ncbi:hypothetical protein G647_04444 [Cladophialophora carrionii CBS 160.54]|uniref:Uncharacterized protein n=1 Tax=Cladophialophora carrionii CBS 160.54 TaxID=1279043 RepID=V9DFG3_9EURO|nr:uncharacterized protein G647_04444 [Cladophialophora carrionii CBS 160.54]ETI25073.1 hypothetical protein G647_04444 [Cladophialophora carrionii CBS 160.54]